MARVLGVQEGAPVAAPAAPTRWRLLGVMAGKNSGGGAAVIAVDDQPAKVFRVGSTVADGLVLQSLRSDTPRTVSLGADVDGPAAVSIELPAIKGLGAAPQPLAAPVADAPQANVDHSTGVLRDR